MIRQMTKAVLIRTLVIIGTAYSQFQKMLDKRKRYDIIKNEHTARCSEQVGKPEQNTKQKLTPVT